MLTELKTTQAETVGVFWRGMRIIMQWVWVLSIPLYWFNHLAGFLGVVLSSTFLSALTGREYLVSSLQRIRTILELRQRLISFGDGEFVLLGIRDEMIWRGEEVTPEVESRLKYYEKLKEEFADQITNLATELFNVNKVDDKTPN